MKNDLSFDRIILPASAAGESGVLALANETRMEAANYSEGVTNFVLGVMGTDLAPLQAELDLIAPPVRTGRRFEYKKAASGLSFLADLEDERAIGAKFRRLEASGTSVYSKTANRGLSYTLDRDEMVDGSIEQTAKWLAAILLRNDLRRALAVLIAANANTGKTWNSSANPDGDLRAALITVLESRGIMPNKLIFGVSAWSKRAAAYEAMTANGALVLAGYTPDQLAAKLGVDKVHVSKTVYKPTEKGTKAGLMSSFVFGTYTDDVVSKEDASNVKRFWTPCDGGEMVRVYVDESAAKTVEVIVEHYSTVALTDSTGVFQLTIS
jgi:hypothetical protein